MWLEGGQLLEWPGCIRGFAHEASSDLALFSQLRQQLEALNVRCNSVVDDIFANAAPLDLGLFSQTRHRLDRFDELYKMHSSQFLFLVGGRRCSCCSGCSPV